MNLPKGVDALRRAREEARLRWEAVRQRIATNAGALEAARAKCVAAGIEVSAFAFVPGEAARTSEDRARVELAEAEAARARLEGDEREARAAYDAARSAYDSALIPLVPRLAEDARDADAAIFKELGTLARATQGPGERLRAALMERAERRAELEQVVGEIQGPDPRVKSRQQSELRSYMRHTAPATPEQVLGWIVWRAVEWARLQSLGLESYWAERGPGPRNGSALYAPVVTQEQALALRDGLVDLEVS